MLIELIAAGCVAPIVLEAAARTLRELLEGLVVRSGPGPTLGTDAAG